MHVVLLGAYPPPHGGVQTHVVLLRRFLLESGVHVSVINITRHRRQDADDVYYPGSAAGLLARVAGLRPDIVHAHLGGNLSARLLGLCLVCAAWPRAASLMTFHSGGYPSSPAGRAASPRSLMGTVLRRLDHVIAVNEEIGTFFRRLGIRSERISVIEPHGQVLSLTGDDESLPGPLAEFVQEHKPLFVTVSGLEPEYCLSLQIAAFPELAARAPHAGLLILGSGSQEHRLRREIAASPVKSRILLAGDIPHASTLHLIRRADVLLRTTSYDGDSLAIREALQLGTPVLASDNGMRPQGVHLLSELSPEALVRQALEVLDLPRPVASCAVADSRHLARVLSVYRGLRSLREPPGAR